MNFSLIIFINNWSSKINPRFDEIPDLFSAFKYTPCGRFALIPDGINTFPPGRISIAAIRVDGLSTHDVTSATLLNG